MDYTLTELTLLYKKLKREIACLNNSITIIQQQIDNLTIEGDIGTLQEVCTEGNTTDTNILMSGAGARHLKISNTSVLNGDVDLEITTTGDFNVRNYANKNLSLWTNNAERLKIFNTGVVRVPNLAGLEPRLVIAGNTGDLSSAVIGSGLNFDGFTLTADGGSGGGSGLTNFSFTDANGFTGTVTNPTTTPTLSLVLRNATSTQAGQLTATDWSTFNSKLSNITGLITQGTNVTITGSGTSGSPYVISSTDTSNPGTVTSFSFTNGGGFTGVVTNGSSTPVLSLTLQSASGTQNGQLTATDWATFNSKLSNITGLIEEGSNVTITGSGTSADPYVINSTASGGGSTLAVGGTGAVQFADGTNFDGETNLFWDKTNNRLGINTSTPSSNLHVSRLSTGVYGDLGVFEDSVNADGFAMFGTKSNGKQFNWGAGGNAETAYGVANSAFIFDLTSDAMRFIIGPTGAVRIPDLAGTGTEMVVASSTGVLSRQAIPSGGSGLSTADNGLTANTSTNVRLGGTLIQNTTLAADTFRLLMTGQNTTQTLTVNNSSSGTGLWGISASGYGVQANSTTGVALLAEVNPTSDNTVIPVAEFSRTTQAGSGGANGMGGSIDMKIKTISDVPVISNQIISKWTTAATATRTSELSITGVNSAVTTNLATLSGNGALKLNQYGDGTFTGTATKWAAFDTDGNVIEVNPPSGSGITTADNGLTANTSSNVRLGGTLLATTNINKAGFDFSILGNGGFLARTQSGNDQGNVATSTNGGALQYANTSTGLVTDVLANNSSSIVSFQGITGSDIKNQVEVNVNGINLFTDVPLTGGKGLKVLVGAQAQLTEYGSGTYTGTATKFLAVTSTGHVIEEDVPLHTDQEVATAQNSWGKVHGSDGADILDDVIIIGSESDDTLRTITLNMVYYRASASVTTGAWETIATIPADARPTVDVHAALPCIVEGSSYTLANVAITGTQELVAPTVRIRTNGDVQVYIKTITTPVVSSAVNYVLVPIAVTYFKHSVALP